MHVLSRRRLLLHSSAAVGLGCLADLGFLAPLRHAAAADTTLDPDGVEYGREVGSLVKLIRDTPREQCVAALVKQLQGGLSYQVFVSALLLAALEHGDPHQVAQVYSAHRISSEARTEERLLPLFWAVDRIKGGFEESAPRRPPVLKGPLPDAGTAAGVFEEAMAARDPDHAERALVALARAQGARHAMSRLWRHGCRRTSGTLGHHPIIVANIWRTMEAIGWRHAEHVLRYIARSLAEHESDRTHAPNVTRVEKLLPALKDDWAAAESDREPAVELYGVLRRGDPDASCDLVCRQLASGRVKAGAVWDAIQLTAADLLVRYKTGGTPIGGMLIHAVTASNALRFGFDCSAHAGTRLLMMLQAAAALGEVFIRPAEKDGQLRDLNLLELPPDEQAPPRLEEIFIRLPGKQNLYTQKDAAERKGSDEACRLALAALRDGRNARAFQQAARTLLCVKATYNPHDIKYPAAAFEDAAHVSPRWQPHLLAASVHALHGPASADSGVLVQARAALAG